MTQATEHNNESFTSIGDNAGNGLFTNNHPSAITASDGVGTLVLEQSTVADNTVHLVAMPVEGTTFNRSTPSPVIIVQMNSDEFRSFILKRTRLQSLSLSIVSNVFCMLFLSIPAVMLACRPITHPKAKKGYRDSMILSTVAIAAGVVTIILLIIFLVAVPNEHRADSIGLRQGAVLPATAG